MILGIDASQSSISLSFRYNQQEIILFKKKLNQFELLPLILQNLLSSQGIELQTLKRIAIITGPGNYTSLRASILVARSLASLYQLPVWGLNRLEMQLYAQRQLDESIWATQFVRMGQFYFAKGQYIDSEFHYDLAPQTASEQDLKTNWLQSPGLISGDWENTETNFKKVALPELSSALSEWCEDTLQAETGWQNLVPFYIRPAVAASSDAELNGKIKLNNKPI